MFVAGNGAADMDRFRKGVFPGAGEEEEVALLGLMGGGAAAAEAEPVIAALAIAVGSRGRVASLGRDSCTCAGAIAEAD